jgi:membrane protein DedA with SNARE-associated domain
MLGLELVANLACALRGPAGLTNVQLFLIKYGLLAVFLAAAFEADVVPVLTGVLAHFGYMDVGLALVCATAGALTGDCVWFLAGRYYENQIQASRFYRKAGPLAERLTSRLGDWQIPASHVIYGTRVATMIFSGTRGLPLARFALVDGLGCFCFTTLFFALGFWFSARSELIIGSVKRIELFLLAAVVLFVLTFYFTKKIRT